MAQWLVSTVLHEQETFQCILEDALIHDYRLPLSRSTSTTANAAKRLWHTLVIKEQLQKIFLDFAFGQNSSRSDKSTGVVSIL